MESPNAIRDVRISLRFVSLINERIQESQVQFKLAFKRKTPGQQAVYLRSSQEERNREEERSCHLS